MKAYYLSAGTCHWKNYGQRLRSLNGLKQEFNYEMARHYRDVSYCSDSYLQCFLPAFQLGIYKTGTNRVCDRNSDKYHL